MNTSAIIVAAGSSRRMGFDKLFAPLHGQFVIAHAIAAFQDCEEIGEIILVAREERIEALQALADEQNFSKIARIIPGGAERHFSVWQGLQAASATADFVAIHDGARALTTPKLIAQCLELARTEGAACCAIPVPDTLKRASAEKIVTESVERDGLWAMQTPQIFSTPLIVQAYSQIITRGELVTDEVSAVQRLGQRIALFANEEWNFKITYPQDLALAEQILRLREAALISP